MYRIITRVLSRISSGNLRRSGCSWIKQRNRPAADPERIIIPISIGLSALPVDSLIAGASGRTGMEKPYQYGNAVVVLKVSVVAVSSAKMS